MQSELFTKTLREAPKDEEALNAKLLIRGGFIHKTMAGVYSYLPLGLRVLRKIEKIIREEMDAVGGQEILLTALQNPELWKKTGRWVAAGVDPTKGLPWFKTALANDAELGIANTHEEPLTDILTHYVSSHRDLPFAAYQIQTKFRNEFRAKSGLLRGREFLMKDLYSFDKTEKERDEFYEQCAAAYLKIFERAGLGDRTYRTFASGGAFAKFSDEFQTVCETGEDTIYIDENTRMAVNKEVHGDEVLKDLGMDRSSLREAKAIEVGNIFKLGTRYSEPLGLTYKDENGAAHPVVMGSYGIGISRLMGTVAEIFNDEKGLKWPESVAPFRVHLIALGDVSGRDVYDNLQAQGVDVLYDERDVSAGEKFADADLLGIPYRAVVSPKTGEKIEIKKRNGEKTELLSAEEILTLLAA